MIYFCIFVSTSTGSTLKLKLMLNIENTNDIPVMINLLKDVRGKLSVITKKDDTIIEIINDRIWQLKQEWKKRSIEAYVNHIKKHTFK